MTDALEQWRNEFPTHAAAQNLPPELEKALATMPFTPKNIAVLLPLTGRYQSQGEAIRDGLVYGYLQGIPSDTKITFYDTASEGAIKAFEQATLDQTDFIIGPLLKGNIETILSQGALTVPLLALNQADITSPDPLLFQFPLAPEDEAAQTAQRIWDDGHRYPLLLLPKGGFGERISDAFTQRWHAILASQGIAIDDDNQQSIEQRFFKDRKTMQKLIEQALGVSESQARIRHMKSLLGNSIEVEPRSRRDLDAIYLIATPIDARLLKPFVDVTVSPFANPLPIYASSRSHELGVTTSQNRELAGVMFSEIPMLLPETEQQSQLQAQSNKLWPTRRAAEQRLFALGMDAYQIIPLLAQMRAFPGYSFDGLTGQLKISDEGQVHRELNWAKITSNGVELMPRKANESTTKAQQP
jgi:outer membrane PBP1 activator LpoA protein